MHSEIEYDLAKVNYYILPEKSSTLKRCHSLSEPLAGTVHKIHQQFLDHTSIWHLPGGTIYRC